MDRLELPASFPDLANPTAEPTIERAQALGRALKAVPDLQAWRREQRQLTVCALLDSPLTREDLTPRLEISPQRVADIASGHGRTKDKRTKPAA
ncbi:sigma-70 family RNA polymerase sigma factor [Streptomyces sp. NPDC005262]|uniref:sigma-70 family RNA polymerase sigma factor n=1 Tax=Streptomyces sp. NPDC005262 TaxID=3364710 RepID=UPI0036791D64